MADPTTKTKSRLRHLGNSLWGIVELAGVKPCREPVVSNAGTTFVLESALQALSVLPRNQRPSGFLGVAGESRFFRTQFPEDLLSIVSEQVDVMVRTLILRDLESPVSIAGDQYKILLVILPARDRVRKWIEEQNYLEQDDKQSRTHRSKTPAQLVTTVLPDLSTDYEERYAALKGFLLECRTGVAALLQPALQEQADSMEIDTYAQKQAVSVWVNSQLRELGLALRCPQTGRPAILVADLRDAETQSSRFRFVIRDSKGRQTKTISSKQLPEMELMPDEPRQESRAKGPAAGRIPMD